MEIKRSPTFFPGEFCYSVVNDDGSQTKIGIFTDEAEAIKAIEEYEKRETTFVEEKKLSPFDYIGLFYKNINPVEDDIVRERSKKYSPFIVNKSLSMSEENVFVASAMDRFAQIVPNHAQIEFLARTTRKPKKWPKWIKADKVKLEKVTKVKEHFNVPLSVAETYIEIMDKEEYESIIAEPETGGKAK